MGKSTKGNTVVVEYTKRRIKALSKLQAIKLKVMSRFEEVTFKEEWIDRYKGGDVYGLHEPDGSITINPIPHVTDTIIHEMLHEIYPDYTERAVRILTGKLMKTLTEEEMKTIYAEYRRRIEE